jgi:hypothetical protein
VVQSNDFFYEELEAMMARVQLVAEGSGRVQRIIQSELGSAWWWMWKSDRSTLRSSLAGVH